ncbi:hypothetical protein HU200_055829 [Digitaria exilis]|uniref:DUF4005 domain-containing protein n=1 Tax=Digitaria exilis TaxID=1010633 RepID=A0A835E378_9POAL|nr:hypothetical protein HU200_055829 [Digitaria exilis]
MGKAARWFRSLLGGGGGGGKKQQEQGKDQQRPPADKKRWSFARSSRDTAEAAAAAAAAADRSVRGGGGGNAAIARAAEAAWLKSLYGETEREQSKHAIAVAAATAAAADAAVAAAQAAVEVVRLTSRAPGFGGGGGAVVDPRGRAGAAVKIQTAFRGFLAKKALRALKALVKLQALVRGYLVRRQAAATLQSMQALVRAQAAVRAARCRAVPQLPPLHHHPPVRPRFSLQERYGDDTRSEHGVAAYSRRLSASIESASYGGGGYDRSPKIVEMDTGRPRSSRASSLRTDASCTGDEWYAAMSVSSPLVPSCGGGGPAPPRIAVPSSRQFPDYEWCAPEKPRPATAQSTPRCAAATYFVAPPTPAKSVCGGGGGNCPGYMSSTQSSEAKSSRSQSAPKQRPEQQQPARKRVPLSEVVLEARASLSGVAMVNNNNNKPTCGNRGAAAQEAFDFRAAVVSRFERAAAAEWERDAFFLQRRW